jgi:hexosaminidase
LKSIVVDDRYAETVDNTGETLIPPTLGSFVQTFSDDLASSLGLNVPIKNGKKAEKDSIFVTIGKADGYKDIAGRNTAEGYSLDVTSEGITITGASPLGAWWATRSILQQAVLGDSDFPYGSGSNSPGWGIRGFMVSGYVSSV